MAVRRADLAEDPVSAALVVGPVLALSRAQLALHGGFLGRLLLRAANERVLMQHPEHFVAVSRDRKGRVREETLRRRPVVDRPETDKARTRVERQRRGVLQRQDRPARNASARRRPHMPREDSVSSHRGIRQEPVGTLRLHRVLDRHRNARRRRAHHVGGDLYQPFRAGAMTKVRTPKLAHRPRRRVQEVHRLLMPDETSDGKHVPPPARTSIRQSGTPRRQTYLPPLHSFGQ